MMLFSHLPRIKPNYACFPSLNSKGVFLFLKSVLVRMIILPPCFPWTIPPWINRNHYSLESGTKMRHVNFTLHWKSKSGLHSRENLQSCQLLAPLIELGETDPFKITSLSVKTTGWSIPNTTYLSEQTLSTHLFLHIVFSTCSRLFTQTAINNISKKQWELMTSFIPSV